MGSVAERLGRRPTATAQHDRVALLREVVLPVVGIDHLDRSGHLVGPVVAGLDHDLFHQTSNPHSAHDTSSARMLRSIIPSAASARSSWMCATPSGGTLTRRWRT